MPVGASRVAKERRRLACKACFCTLKRYAISRRCPVLPLRASRSLQASRLRSFATRLCLTDFESSLDQPKPLNGSSYD
jgi:hypothetical protein